MYRFLEKSQGGKYNKTNTMSGHSKWSKVKHQKAGTDALESLTYEGFGPGGVALIIEAATDNRTRTVSQVKHILEKS